MRDDTANLLMQGTPDRGPARTLMSMIAAIVAISTTAATGLFGAQKAELAAGVLMGGMVLALAFFWIFRSHIVGRRCFNAALPFEIDLKDIQEARGHMEGLRAQCENQIRSVVTVANTKVRANIFRPSDEYQKYGCACILKMDPQLESGMMQMEIDNVRFLPGAGHTGRAFMTANTSFGAPTVGITREQLAYVSPNLAYIMSCPLKWNSGVVGVMNIDFSCPGENPGEAQKQALVAEVEKVKDKLLALAEKKAPLVAKALGNGKLQPIWLLCGP